MLSGNRLRVLARTAQADEQINHGVVGHGFVAAGRRGCATRLLVLKHRTKQNPVS
jgi:hypothetical protein